MSRPELTAHRYTRWTQDYRGIAVEIAFWGKPDEPEYYQDGPLAGMPKGVNDGNGIWNFYLWLREEQFSPEDFARLWLPPKVKTWGEREHITYDYYVFPFNEMEFHSGCTYYAKKGGLDGSPRAVKVGCDYAHHWDQGRKYTKELVWWDACACVDSLYALMPNIKRRCFWNGNYYDASEGEETESGAWRSFESMRQESKV